MKPIPKKAMPVVEILRKEIKKPKSLPGFITGIYLRWPRRRNGNWNCCPLGLLKDAPVPDPCTGFWPQSLIGHIAAGKEFIEWWDKLPLKDAQKAVDAIWGKK